MSSTCVYSDIVLPTATGYEKDDMNTSDMHPFIHPLSAAIDPAWEAKSDWEIYKGIAKAFEDGRRSAGRGEGLGHRAAPARQPRRTGAAVRRYRLEDRWRRSAAGQELPEHGRGRARLPGHLQEVHLLGPLLDKLGNGGKGINWNTQDEVDFLGELNYKVRDEGVSQGRPQIESAIDAAEVILSPHRKPMVTLP